MFHHRSRGNTNYTVASALLFALLKESRILAEDASLKGGSCLDQAINFSLAICFTELKVDSHVVTAAGDAPEESHGVIQHLLLVCTGGLGVNNCCLCIANFPFQAGLLCRKALDQGLSVRLESFVLCFG